VTGISTVALPELGAAKTADPTRACMHESEGAGMPCAVRSEVESTSPAGPTTAKSLALAPVWSDVGSVASALLRHRRKPAAMPADTAEAFAIVPPVTVTAPSETKTVGPVTFPGEVDPTGADKPAIPASPPPELPPRPVPRLRLPVRTPLLVVPPELLSVCNMTISSSLRWSSGVRAVAVGGVAALAEDAGAAVCTPDGAELDGASEGAALAEGAGNSVDTVATLGGSCAPAHAPIPPIAARRATLPKNPLCPRMETMAHQTRKAPLRQPSFGDPKIDINVERPWISGPPGGADFLRHSAWWAVLFGEKGCAHPARSVLVGGGLEMRDRCTGKGAHP